MSLRLVLVSVEGTIAADGAMRNDVAAQIAALAHELHGHGVSVALWSNKKWMVNKTTPLEQHMSSLAGVPIKIHGVSNDSSPARRTKNSALPILAKYGVAVHETVLVGGMNDDMIAGVNSGLLLIRPNWYGVHTDYGFPVDTVSELRRFLLLFALRQHPIFWRINAHSVDASAGGPFSTMIAAYADFGDAAKMAAKHGTGRKDFWFYFIVASLYFGGLVHDVDCICSYPGHGIGPPSPMKQELHATLTRLGRCFNKPYYADLIVRHTLAVKSQTVPTAARRFLPQLNTIRLNKHPHKNLGASSKSAINLKGKRVLVVDDFCTSGRSLEAARAFLQAAGATMRSFCWLKTINMAYERMIPLPPFDPFSAQTFANEPASAQHTYQAAIVAPHAPGEISTIYRQYLTWK